MKCTLLRKGQKQTLLIFYSEIPVFLHVSEYWMLTKVQIRQKQTGKVHFVRAVELDVTEYIVTCLLYWRRRSDCYFVLFTASLIVTTITFTM
jgi:hypothetical protein